MVEYTESIEYAKGLEGVIVNESKIGYVNGAEGQLNYRGLNIEILAESSTFEETAFLLLCGYLPNRTELSEFKLKLSKNRQLPPEIINLLRFSIPTDSHPMGALRTAVSLLGNLDKDAEKEFSAEHFLETGIRLVGVIPSIVAAYARIRAGKEPIDPDLDLAHTENFLYMYFGVKPESKVVKLMDVAMILHADHGMNASTFTGLVTMSSQSDLYSSVTAAIGSLKGPLHGGANERAIKMLQNIPSINDVESFVHEYQAQKKRFMGWGHRVYKAYDPRARIFGKLAANVASGEIYAKAKKLEEILLEKLKLGDKGIFPNVDFYSGAVYSALGIETDDFTPIFAMSRITGWIARMIEYIPMNRIFRPRAIYTGELKSKYISIDDRI